MFTDNEVFYVRPATYGFSNVILDRVAKSSFGVELSTLETISTADERGELMNLLNKQTDDLLAEINIKKVDTKGCHDVVFGNQQLGDFYYSDMISGLYDIKSTDSILDFGCSTGRVIRNLRSAFEFNAFGCDPRDSSIEFNKKHFDDVTWFTSNEAPPIQSVHTHSYNMVFAISVWSHFSPEMCLKWFDEFHSRLSDNGKIIFTTHGTRSVYHLHKRLGRMPADKATERLNVLRDGGYHYLPYPSGSDLDSKHWGMAFISREWLEKKLGDKWKITNHLPGLAMENQDVYVIQKS